MMSLSIGEEGWLSTGLKQWTMLVTVGNRRLSKSEELSPDLKVDLLRTTITQPTSYASLSATTASLP